MPDNQPAPTPNSPSADEALQDAKAAVRLFNLARQHGKFVTGCAAFILAAYQAVMGMNALNDRVDRLEKKVDRIAIKLSVDDPQPSSVASIKR